LGVADDPKPSRRTLSGDELEARMAEIEKGQQLAGHFPSDEALGRARKILTGELTPEEAYAEVELKWAAHAADQPDEGPFAGSEPR
jgi:hypothetical protein